MPQQYLGGSFAPPLTDDLLAKYKATIDNLPSSALKDGLASLYTACAKWWELPEPLADAARVNHALLGQGVILISEEHVAALDEHIPWPEEVNAIHALCDEIPASQTDLRNAAFHLLWHVRHLEIGWEPLTTDKLAGLI